MPLDVAFPGPSHAFAPGSSFSPLVLADRLLTLAQEADRAGYHDSALRLLSLIDAVLDNPDGRH